MKEFSTPVFLSSSNIYEVNIRQYTPEGTFRAFAAHIPRLKGMGVEILWLMPIHPIGKINRKGTLGSYYSIAHHTALNSEFGDEADFDFLVDVIHKAGMKVILDWVANHAAWDHIWTKLNPDFFKRGAFGFESPFDWTDVIQIDHSNMKERDAMIEAMMYWVEERGIDGFRADLAHLTPLDFWIEARRKCDKIKPGLIWLAESENENYTEAFDITFTWRWMHAAERAIKEENAPTTLFKFLQQQDLPGLRLYFTSNHDENSWNGTEWEKYGIYARALAVFSFLYKDAIPLLYSGQEIPNFKRLAFFDKDTLKWHFPPELEDFYKKLYIIRKESNVFNSVSEVKLYRHNELLIYSLHSNDKMLLVALHFGISKIKFQPALYTGIAGKEIFTGTQWGPSIDPVEFSPGEFMVISTK